MSKDRFAGVDRGRALRGSRAIAAYLLGDPEATETVFALPRAEFGIVTLGRDLTAFSGWLDHALAARARTAKSRRRSTSKAVPKAEAETADA
jgi:hypothetical protein